MYCERTLTIGSLTNLFKAGMLTPTEYMGEIGFTRRTVPCTCPTGSC